MADRETQTNVAPPNPPPTGQQNWRPPVGSQYRSPRPLPAEPRSTPFAIGHVSARPWEQIRPQYQHNLNSVRQPQPSPSYDQGEIQAKIQGAVEYCRTQWGSDLAKFISELRTQCETDLAKSIDELRTQGRTDLTKSIDEVWSEFSAWGKDHNKYIESQGAAVYSQIGTMEKHISGLMEGLRLIRISIDASANTTESEINAMKSEINAMKSKINAMESEIWERHAKAEQEQALNSPKNHQTATPRIERPQESSVGTTRQEDATEPVGNNSKKRKVEGPTPEDIHRVWNINEQDGESELG